MTSSSLNFPPTGLTRLWRLSRSAWNSSRIPNLTCLSWRRLPWDRGSERWKNWRTEPMYKNNEGYPDPTSGEALGNIARQERAEKRAAMKQEKKYLPKIYICSPFAGDTEGNIKKGAPLLLICCGAGIHPFTPATYSSRSSCRTMIRISVSWDCLWAWCIWTAAKSAGCSERQSQAGWSPR